MVAQSGRAGSGKSPSQKTIARTLQTTDQGRTALFACDSLKILKLEGSSVERARNHGRLAGTHLTNGVLKYFASKVREPIAGLRGPVGTLADKALAKWMRSLHRDVPSVMQDELAALARGAGLTSDEIIFASSGPDLGTMANGWMKNTMVSWARLAFGCTTLSNRAENGDFVFARNLDFAGIGVFDANPMVTVHLPDSPNELKRISIGADLVHFASISAVNEAGIGLVVHQNFVRVTATRSMPLILIGDWILRQARSLDQAVELLSAHRPGPMWTFVFFDLKTGESRAVETGRDHFGVRHANEDTGHLCHTNHSQTEAGLELQYSAHGTYANSCFRLSEVERIASASAEDGDQLVNRFAHALALRDEKARPELTVFNDVIKPITIQSVIFERKASDKGLGRLWVSKDPAPSSSGAYIELDLDALFGDTAMTAPEFKIVDFVETPADERRYHQRMAQASHLAFDERQFGEALALLDGHTSAGALLIRAVLATKCERFDEADALAAEALEHYVPQHIRESLMWIRCVALVGSGKTTAAQAIARALTAEDPQNTMVARGARRLAKGRPLRLHERNLIVDFFAGDLFSPPQLNS